MVPGGVVDCGDVEGATGAVASVVTVAVIS
jgi:hypothetical protein